MDVGLGEAASTAEGASALDAVARGRARAALILCSSSIFCCLSASRSWSRCSRSALACEGSAIRPLSSAGTLRCGWAGAIRGNGVNLGFTASFSRAANAFSLSSNAFSRASKSAFRWASCCSAVESCFWHEQTSAKGISNERKNNFFIRRRIRFCSEDEENGSLPRCQTKVNLLAGRSRTKSLV